MIVSHSHRYIFIKSIKTAGTSIEAALSQHCNADDMVTPLGDYWFNRDERGKWIHSSMNAEGFSQHDPASEVKRKVPADIWSNYFKFSIARNPWDRVVSLFAWEARNKPELKPAKRFYHRLGIPFNEFAATKKIFRDFVAGDWTTNDPFYLIDGRLCVDFVIRYESLAADFAEVCKRVGLPPLGLPHLKTGLREAAHGYTDYFDDDTREIVAARHASDIRLFGYEFGKAETSTVPRDAGLGPAARVSSPS